jgi:hypothetical protein
MTDYPNDRVDVWDRDGLWVDNVLHWNGSPEISECACKDCGCDLCGENFGGGLVEVPSGISIPGLAPGDVLYIGGGVHSCPVYKVSGWDDFYRQGGTVDVSGGQITAVTTSYTSKGETAVAAARGLIESGNSSRAASPSISAQSQSVIRYYVPTEGFVKIEMFDVSGKLIAMPVRQVVSQGVHYAKVDPARNAAGAGYYIVRMRTGASAVTAKLTLSR